MRICRISLTPCNRKKKAFENNAAQNTGIHQLHLESLDNKQVNGSSKFQVGYCRLGNKLSMGDG